jgi:hypothetical protein
MQNKSISIPHAFNKMVLKVTELNSHINKIGFRKLGLILRLFNNAIRTAEVMSI